MQQKRRQSHCRSYERQWNTTKAKAVSYRRLVDRGGVDEIDETAALELAGVSVSEPPATAEVIRAILLGGIL